MMKTSDWKSSFVSIILSFCVGLISPVVGRADTRADADRIIQLSHEGAEDLAKALFNHYLFQGFTEMVQQNHSMTNLVRSTVIMQAILKEQTGNMTDLEIGVEDVIALASQHWRAKSEIQEKVLKLMTVRRSMAKTLQQIRYSSNSAQHAAEKGVEFVSRILGHLRTACQKGVESQFYIPSLPPVTIRPPEFFVGFQLSMSLEGEGANASMSMEYSPMPDPTLADLFGNDENAGAYAAAVGAVSTIALAVWMAGGAASFSALSAISQAAWMGLAVLIVAIVILIVSIFQDIEARKKAKDQVRAVEDSVHHRANAEDVAEKFRQLCMKNATPLFQLENQLISNQPISPATPEEIDFIADFNKGYSKHYEPIIQEFVRLTEEENKTPDEARKIIADLPAVKKLQGFVQEKMTVNKLVQSLRAQLSQVVTQSHQAEVEVEQFMVDQFLDTNSHYRQMKKRLDWLDGKIVAMYGASYSHSLNRDFPKLFDASRSEYNERVDSSQLITRWHRYLATYIDHRELMESNDRSAEEKGNYNQLLFQLQTLKTDMDFFLILYPKSTSILELLGFADEILKRHSYE